MGANSLCREEDWRHAEDPPEICNWELTSARASGSLRPRKSHREGLGEPTRGGNYLCPRCWGLRQATPKICLSGTDFLN